MIKRVLTATGLVAFALLSGVLFSGTAHAEIQWESWSNAAFERAKRENKLIFVDVGTEWCSACNAMEAGSYRDPKVQALLAKNYVAIHVDAEAEPDVGERYGFWGWPALVFMTPEGEHIHFVRGYMVPKDFVWLLGLLQERFENGTIKVPDIPVDLVATSVAGPVEAMIETARAAVDRFYDAEHHGWGRPKMAFHDLVQQAIWRGHASKDTVWKDRALATAEKTVKLMDPIWGGVFFGAFGPDWTGLIHERRTEHQASAIIIFAEAYALTGDKKWLARAESIVRLLDDKFRTDAGTYFTSQEQQLAGEGAPSPGVYFAKSDAARRKLGEPAIDTTVYADINAKLALAFAGLYEMSRDPAHLDRAVTVGRALLGARAGEGWVRQILAPPKSADRIRTLPADVNDHVYLRAQNFSGLAFLRLYRATGEVPWFEAAHGLGRAMIGKLWHRPEKAEAGNAFLGSNRRVVMPNGHVVEDRPLVDNGGAAEFLLRLAAYGKGRIGEDEIKDLVSRAEQALRSSSEPRFVRENDRFIGQYVLAVHALRDEFIDVTIVCANREAPRCEALRKRALHEAPHIRKIVKVEAPGRYPDTGEPAAYVCTSKLCSSPLPGSDADVAAKIGAFMARLDDVAKGAAK